MNRNETIKIMAVLKGAYPSYYKDLKKDEAENTIGLWQEMFAEDTYSAVAMAVKSFIATDTKGFPPVIGVIKDWIIKLTTPNEMSEMEAWGLITKALKNSIYGYQEEYAKLPPLLQQIIGSADVLKEWAIIDTSNLQTVIQSNFMRSYKAKAKSAKEYLALPSEIKIMTDKLTKQFEIPKLSEFERLELTENGE